MRKIVLLWHTLRVGHLQLTMKKANIFPSNTLSVHYMNKSSRCLLSFLIVPKLLEFIFSILQIWSEWWKLFMDHILLLKLSQPPLKHVELSKSFQFLLGIAQPLYSIDFWEFIWIKVRNWCMNTVIYHIKLTRSSLISDFWWVHWQLLIWMD